MIFARSSLFWLGLALALLVPGCAVGPDYRRPAVAAPATFRGAPASDSSNSLADLPWWSVFKDPALQALIETALTNNYELRMAVCRVEQARLLQTQAQSAFLPQVGYGAEAARGKNMFLNLPNPNGGKITDSYLAGIGAVWELDLWGRLRRQNEAAGAAFLATREAQYGVRLSLVGAVARAYLELLELDERLEIARRTTDSFERTFQLFKDQHDNGLTSKLEISRARAAWRSVSASIPDLKRQIELKENEINVLLGRNPGPVPRQTGLLADLVSPEVPAGLPAALLERRPDIRQAEQQLRTANSRIGMAAGEFLPKIGLTALYGGVSTELSALTSGAANTWSLAANVTGPIFQGGRLKARYLQAQAAREEARLHYRKTALDAFREVADALASRHYLEEARRNQAEAVEAYRQGKLLRSSRGPAAALSRGECAIADPNGSATGYCSALQSPGGRLGDCGAPVERAAGLISNSGRCCVP